MLEQLDSPTGTQGGDNPAAESISRKDVLLAWLAGAFDGEGCIYAYFRTQTNPKCRGRRTLGIGATISNNHPLFIEKVGSALKIIGVQFSYTVAGRDIKTRRNVCVDIKIAGKGRLRALLTAIIPYLSCKRKQAELVLELIDYRESLAARSQNKKGVFQEMTLEDDETVVNLVQAIKDEKWQYRSPLTFSRKPNAVFDASSTTLCSPSDRTMIKADLHGDMQRLAEQETTSPPI